MQKIRDLLAKKAHQGVLTLDADSTVLDAARHMDEANLGSVVVLDQGRLAGIFSERDLMRRVIVKGLDVERTLVRDVMTKDLIYTEEDESVAEAMAKMSQKRCRHLPVIDGDRLIGLVSSGDVMRELTEEKIVEIEFLRTYIYS